MDLEVQALDAPFGSSITRVTQLPRLFFTNSIADVSSEMIPLLEIVFKVKQAMLENVKAFDDQKARAAVLYDKDGKDDQVLINVGFWRCLFWMSSNF